MLRKKNATFDLDPDFVSCILHQIRLILEKIRFSVSCLQNTTISEI